MKDLTETQSSRHGDRHCRSLGAGQVQREAATTSAASPRRTRPPPVCCACGVIMKASRRSPLTAAALGGARAITPFAIHRPGRSRALFFYKAPHESWLSASHPFILFTLPVAASPARLGALGCTSPPLLSPPSVILSKVPPCACWMSPQFDALFALLALVRGFLDPNLLAGGRALHRGAGLLLVLAIPLAFKSLSRSTMRGWIEGGRLAAGTFSPESIIACRANGSGRFAVMAPRRRRRHLQRRPAAIRQHRRQRAGAGIRRHLHLALPGTGSPSG